MIALGALGLLLGPFVLGAAIGFLAIKLIRQKIEENKHD